MRLRLKQLLAELNIRQSGLARSCGVSEALLAQLANHGLWPRNRSLARTLRADILRELQAAGASEEQLQTVFEEWPAQHGNAAQADAPEPLNEDEDDAMLLRNETLTVEAREHFGLPRSPFIDDISALADVFVSASTRRARVALMDCALNQGFVALVGESGSGKTTLREELEERIRIEARPVVVIKPYVLEATKDARASWRSRQIAEAIVSTLAPGVAVKQSGQARARQVHELLQASQRAGYNNLLLIEEAHLLPKSTLRALKAFMEMKDGLRRLLGVVLIGQTELDDTLNDKLADVREIVQRCERREMLPLDEDLPAYLKHKFGRVGVNVADVLADDAHDAIRARLIRIPRGGTPKDARSLCFPLVVNNLVTRAMNAAAAVAYPRVSADVIGGC